MASSDYDTYGKLMAKNVYLDESGLRFHDANDDSKTITLKAQGIQPGNADVTLPVDAGPLLSSGSDLSASKITGINSLPSETVVDGDTFMFADASDTHAPKRALASELKTYCNAGNESLPSGSQNGQMVFYDNDLSQWSAAAPSGDVSADKTGQMTVANGAIDNAKISGGAAIEKSKLAALNIDNNDVAAAAGIEKSKLAALNIDNSDVAAGAAIEKSKLASLEIENADVAANAAIATSKLADAPATAGTVEASKLVQADANKDVSGARHVTAEGTVEAGAAEAFRLGGDSDGSWRVRVNGGDLVFEKKETGTWVQKGSFTAS